MPESIVSLDWSNPIVSDNSSSILFPKDTLDRAKYASFLHNYLVNNAGEGGYVLNLDAKWGAGKTYFIKRWIESIKHTHPVVYVDAWKQDYSNDPMLTVISSIIETLEHDLPAGNKIAVKITSKASRFIKAAGPALVKGLVKKATGMDIDDISTDVDVTTPPAVDESSEPNSSVLSGDEGAALAKCLIDDHNSKLKSVEFLRDDLKNLIDAVIAHKTDYKAPAFIFLDELDRCRPSYAVEMLEVIKHFFELDNIVFVVATDTEQLQHAVKAVYGEGFNAQTYLGRFFRRRYSLTELSRHEFVMNIVSNKVTYNSDWQEHVPSISELAYFSSIVSIVADRFRLSLRDTEQLTDKFLAVLSNTKKTMNPYLLLILFVLKDKHQGVYDEWMEATNKNHDFNSALTGITYFIGKFDVNVDTFRDIFFPINGANNGVYLGVTLNSILRDMNNLLLLKSSGEKMQYQQQQTKQIEKTPSNEGKASLMFKLSLHNLTAKKEDYKNWVELAFSFG